MHQYGTKIFCQIYHAGRQSSQHVNGGKQIVAPSAIPCPWLREMPKALSIAEIRLLVKEFGDTALRAKKSGFDGVEIHAAHGYLIAQFMSAYANKRTDEYGGSLNNRLRFVREIYADVRSKVGDDYPVIIRFSAIEDVPGGRDMAESRILAKEFERWGFDALNVSCAVYGDRNRQIVSPMYVSNAWQADIAKEIKDLVSIPVFTVNRILDPLMAESLLNAGVADIIGMGRQSLADPAMPNKALAGDFDKIRYCINCLQGCTGALYVGGPVTCLVNPSLGLESEVDDEHPEMAKESKKVFIAGGGPGGLQAARTAALRGHEVSLFEKREFLGGQFVSAAYPPSKGGLTAFTAWQISEVKRLGIRIFTSTELTADIVKNDKPDVVIIATGGEAVRPKIKGIDGPNVYLAEDVLLGKVEVADNVVICGGGEVGCELSAHLGSIQKNSVVVEMQNRLMADLDGVNRTYLTELMRKYDVKSYIDTKVMGIDEGGVVAERNAQEIRIKGDSVVLAFGYKPFNKLAKELEKTAANVVVIGGATKTSNAQAAIKDAFDAALAI